MPGMNRRRSRPISADASVQPSFARCPYNLNAYQPRASACCAENYLAVLGHAGCYPEPFWKGPHMMPTRGRSAQARRGAAVPLLPAAAAGGGPAVCVVRAAPLAACLATCTAPRRARASSETVDLARFRRGGSTPSSGSWRAAAWRASRAPGRACSPPAPAVPTACSSTLCGPGQCVCIRATRSIRSRPSPNSGASCWPASAPARRRSWHATTACARWCRG